MKNPLASFIHVQSTETDFVSLDGQFKHEQNRYTIQLPDRDLLMCSCERAYRRPGCPSFDSRSNMSSIDLLTTFDDVILSRDDVFCHVMTSYHTCDSDPAQ